MRSLYFNRQGEPITQEQWARLFENQQYKVVQQMVVGRYHVSTVWLGLDHGFNGTRAIFETMVFAAGLGEEAIDRYTRRYGTEEEALAGHAEVCAQVRALLN